MRESLPVDPFIGDIVDRVRQSRALVLTAEPGAGKTTRVPPALAADGPLILLQPRRVAARAIAQRIADEQGWSIGDEIGWQIRFERRFSRRTRLLVVTEGVLTARLQQDPLLSDFRTVVLDEFHERSVHADLGIALAKQAWRARADLRIVVMSATIDAGSISEFLDHCPIIRVPGRTHPLEIGYAPAQPLAAAVADVLKASPGDVLCFLPGSSEVRRAIAEIESRQAASGIELVPLYGALDGASQDAALRPSPRRRVVVATNIAETSVTVPAVTGVVDTGLHKVARYDAERAVDSLEVERIPLDAADQRAGRAGRVGPGTVRRLWDSRQKLQAHREPEIGRVDLSGTLLDIIAWGGDPRRLEWFERPRDEAIDAALALLGRLGAVHEGKLTATGQRMHRLPLHPRLARMLVASGGSPAMAKACALLSERHFLPPRIASTSSDLLSAIDDWRSVPSHVQRVAQEIQEIASAALASAPHRTAPVSEADFREATLAGYPDRVAQRREPQSARVLLASGGGAIISNDSGVTEGEFLVALDVQAAGGQARIRVASRVEREWLQPNAREVVHRFDREKSVVRAAVVTRYDALVLAEQATTPDPDVACSLLADAWLEQGPRDEDEQLLRRLRFVGHDIDLADLVRAAVRGARALNDVVLERGVPAEMLRRIERDAPVFLKVPSGRQARLDYGADGSVSASVKLQELFGLADTPRVGRQQAPVLLSLLAPNGRPVQTTRDLRSFWDRTYPEVRKELRGRYPKHPWPDDPWKASPTAKAITRRAFGPQGRK